MMEFNPIQAVVDGLAKTWQEERSQTQMTLGQLIKVLETKDQDQGIVGMTKPHSYRGYYCDLAFEPTDDSVSVKDFLALLRGGCMGRIFEGYKGGDYMMGENTPIWISEYSDNSGIKLMGLTETEGIIVLITEQEDE